MIIKYIVNQTAQAKKNIQKSLGLPFKKYLSEEMILEEIRASDHAFRNRIFNPFVTIILYLSQVIDQDQSCRKTLSRFIGHCIENKIAPPSNSTGAYCQARKRLPIKILINLFEKIAETLERKVTVDQRSFGKVVKIIDGSNVSMPDTKEHQLKYPQHARQKAGCGFPLAYVGAIFSQATGAILKLSFGNKHDSERARFQKIWHCLKPGEILLADCYYATYYLVSSLLCKDVDIVMQQHHKRKSDFNKGEILGDNDHLIEWNIPKFKNIAKITGKEYSDLPKTVTLREIKFFIKRNGYRDKSLIIITTLLCPIKYPAEEIGDLYSKRWRCEIGFKDLKTTMGMDVVKGKSLDMVHKDIYIRLLAYNIIRMIIWDAHKFEKVKADYFEISLKGCLQHCNIFFPLISNANKSKMRQLNQTLLRLIATEINPYRPHRYYSRVLKRRPKLFSLMIKPRLSYIDHAA